MKKLFGMMFVLALSTGAFAGEKVEVTVKGMVCSFCSQGITKKFNEEGVKSVNVDLANHLVSLELQDNQKLENEKINGILEKAGYGVEKIERK